MNVIRKLVLTNGLVLTQGQPWCEVAGLGNLFESGPGKPLPKSVTIYMIVFAAEIAQLGEDDEAWVPAQYKLLLADTGADIPRGLAPHGKDGSVTFVIDIDPRDVLLACRMQDFDTALEEFRQFLQEDGNEEIKPPEKTAQSTAAAPSS